MLIKVLSSQEQQRQLNTFVDFFERELIAELSYLEEVGRGNIGARKDESLAMLFNVACALVSLAPVPGGVLAFMALPHVLKAAVDVGTAIIESELSQQVFSTVQDYLKDKIKDKVTEALSDKTAEPVNLGEDLPLDISALSVLARWLGLGLARRYEQVLSERLSTQPEQALVGLARVAARRCLSYLSQHPLPAGDYKHHTEHLLTGVLVGASIPWYQQPLQWLKSGERLQGRDELSSLRFTAEDLFVNGAWIEPDSALSACYTHAKTEWLAASMGGGPKYGYVSGQPSTAALKLRAQDSGPDLNAWQGRRLQQPVSKAHLMRYLASPEVTEARANNQTASQTFIEFLHQESPSTFPKAAQAVLCEDLSELSLRCGNFQGVDFSGSRIRGDVSYASFEKAYLYGCDAQELSADKDSRVGFAQAQLGFSTLTEGRFGGTVDFTQANLTCVDLSKASFGNVILPGAIWHKAKLVNVEYDGIQKAQEAQLDLITSEQDNQRQQLKDINQKLQDLETLVAQYKDAAQNEPSEQIESLLSAHLNQLKFEAYTRDKLVQLSQQGEGHAEEILALNSTLESLRNTLDSRERALRAELAQLQQDVSDLQTRARKNSEDKLAIQDKLAQLQTALEKISSQALSNTATPEEKQAYLEKSAIAKILTQYKKVLSEEKRQELSYYIRPDVVNHVPDSMSAAEFVSKMETKEIENKSRPLLAEVEDYLQSDESMMLLLGDPGAGKSLFAWYSTQSRLQDYQRVLEGVHSADTPWLPIVIELKHYRMSEIKGLLPRYLSEHCKLSSEEQVAIQQDKNPKHRILLVLDGFDELRQEDHNQAEQIKKTFEDCLSTCGANAWYFGQVKVVVTCRLRHIPDTGVEKRYFGHGIEKAFRHRVILPFSSAQIDSYLAERIEARDQDSNLLAAEVYQSTINASDAIKAMVRNPFVLRLFVDALPELQKQGRELSQIKRYDIYRAFVSQWFARETQRLPAAIRVQLPTANLGSSVGAEGAFELYAATLANEMYRQDSLVVSLNREHEHPAIAVWDGFEERMLKDSEASIAAVLSARYQKLGPIDKARLKKESINDVAQYIERYKDSEEANVLNELSLGLEAFKITSPLKQQGKVCSFIHKSFYEFFLVQSILHHAASEDSLERRVAHTLKSLSAAQEHELRRIQDEPQVLIFLEDVWIGQSQTPLIQRLKETLFAVIEASKGHAEHGAAAANAITMLNWMGTMLMYQSWQEIQIPGANLAYAQLRGSNLTRANLQGARLFRANLRDVNLSHANLAHVEFMELAPIKAEDECNAIAYHPTKPWIAIVGGKHIRQYDTERNEWVREAMEGHTGPVTSVAYSPDGRYLASGGFDKTVRQWEASTGQAFGPVMQGHTELVMSVAYSPDGRYLASGSYDKTVRQWEATTGQAFGPVMQGHTDKVSSVAYSPDGRYLASTGDDYRICVWNSGLGGDFSMIWCTRSGANHLVGIGLCLNGALGLKGQQIALLAYAGWDETKAVEPMPSTNPSTFFAPPKPRPQITTPSVIDLSDVTENNPEADCHCVLQ